MQIKDELIQNHPRQERDQYSQKSHTLSILRLGRKPYKEVWDLQKELVNKRQQQLISDTLILVEHYPVYTLGKNADKNHLLQSRESNVPVFHIERGGDVTYHGPGQLVGYPIIDLHNHRMSVSWFMNSMEEVIINTLSNFRIEAGRIENLTGVWVGKSKIAAMGVRLSRWVSMHGFALNVNTELSYYDGIIPCGIFDYGVTSMELILDRNISMSEVEVVLIKEFVKKFNFDIVLDV